MNIEDLILKYTEFADKAITENSLLKDELLAWTNIKEECNEYFAQIYIAYTCDTQDEEKTNAYTEAIEKMEILSPLHHKIAQKITSHFKIPSEDMKYAYELIKNDMDLFKEENIVLETQESKLSQEYQGIIGALSIEHEGKKIPLSMARPLLEKPDRTLRERTFKKISIANKEVSDKISQIFQHQVELRESIAKNLDKANYRDYMHQAKARFDYTPKDCLLFSQSILSEIVPVSLSLHQNRKKIMGLEELAPFDTACDSQARPALSPASTREEFLEKSIIVLGQVDPEIGQTLINLKENGQLDLFSRQGKAPGGYNYPLSVSKTSFIFMNSSLTHQDAVTLFHETGHAYHFDLYKNNNDPFLYKSPSSEIAELASMTMELMCMEHWSILYPNPEELKRAKRQQIEGIIHFFPWMAVVDSFQHWVYLNPKASIEERNQYFVTLYQQFLPGISWKGYEEFLPTFWQKQLHILEIPFYYIEYGIAQLGALQLWKIYKSNPQEGLKQYKKALAFASKGPISEAYAQAGMRIDFSAEHIKELIQFAKAELDAL